MKKKRIGCGVMVLLTLIFIAVCGTEAAGPPETIKIGASIPVTGKFASGGYMVKLGYEIAVDFINKAGGIYVKEFGKKLPLELIILDHSCPN